MGREADAIARGLRSIQSRSGHNLSRIWDDWISSMALDIANHVDHRPTIWREREDEYMRIVARHGSDVMAVFKSLMLDHVVEGLSVEDPGDFLGSIYMALELGSDHAGQFFTPTDVCRVMAAMTYTPDELRADVAANGWIRFHEPAIGGGATVIPLVVAMRRAGLDPAHYMHVTGVDIDVTVLRMAYVQLSLLGVPAALYVGDSLRMQMTSDWYTPVHVLHGWGPRLRGEPEPPDAVRPAPPEPEPGPELALKALVDALDALLSLTADRPDEPSPTDSHEPAEQGEAAVVQPEAEPGDVDRSRVEQLDLF